MTEIDKRVCDIIIQFNNTVVHFEKVKIIIDCLRTFSFFRRAMPMQTQTSEDAYVRALFALAQLHSFVLLTTPEQWLAFVANTSFEKTRELAIGIVEEVRREFNEVFPGSGPLFEVPTSRWLSADVDDLIILKDVLSSTPRSVLSSNKINLEKTLAEIDSCVANIGEQPIMEFSKLDEFADNAIRIQQIEVYENIGHGTFAIIFSGGYLATSQAIAIKFFPVAHLKQEPFLQFMNEVTALTNLQHRGIINMVGYTNRAPYCIFTELVPQGSLYQVLRNQMELNFDCIASSLAETLQYIHARGCIHGDIKSLNVLVSNPTEAKLCDFGSSRRIVKNTYVTGAVGTDAWAAPELLKIPRQVTEKSDVYSFGLLLLEMLTCGKSPIPAKTVPKDAPAPLKALIEKCLDQVPENRPTMREIWTLFMNDEVSFQEDPDEDVEVSAEIVNTLVNNPSVYHWNLLADICFEIPEVGPTIQHKIMQFKTDDTELIAAQIRLLRTICVTADAAGSFIMSNGIAFCLNNLDDPQLQVRALFLLLNVVRLAEAELTPEQIDVLMEWSDSDIVALILMFGAPFDETMIEMLLKRVLEAHVKLSEALTTAFQAFLSYREEPLSQKSVCQITAAMLLILRSDNEKMASQAISVLIDTYVDSVYETKLRGSHMLTMCKWIYMGSPPTQIKVAQLLVLIYSHENVKVDHENNFEFVLILIRSLPYSQAQTSVGDVLLKILESKEAALWFIRTQLIKMMTYDSSYKYKLVVFKMLIIAASHRFCKQEELCDPSVLKLVTEFMSSKDPKLVRICARYFEATHTFYEIIKTVGCHFFIDLLFTVDDVDAKRDILRLIAASIEMNIRWPDIANTLAPMLDNPDLQIHVVHVLFEEWMMTHDQSLITPALRTILAENQSDDKCSAFIAATAGIKISC